MEPSASATRWVNVLGHAVSAVAMVLPAFVYVQNGTSAKFAAALVFAVIVPAGEQYRRVEGQLRREHVFFLGVAYVMAALITGFAVTAAQAIERQMHASDDPLGYVIWVVGALSGAQLFVVIGLVWLVRTLRSR